MSNLIKIDFTHIWHGQHGREPGNVNFRNVIVNVSISVLMAFILTVIPWCLIDDSHNWVSNGFVPNSSPLN